MKKDYFEVTHRDIMGRVGRLKTPHGTIQTPALMPVVNPNIDFIPPSELRKFGAEILITNSYIIYRNERLREVAVEKGVHSLLKTDMPVMTDSGSYQLMVYGDVEVKNREILLFQKEIGSDIAVPLDIPTPPDADESLILEDMEETLRREREGAEIFSGSESLIAFPVQGSTNPEMRRKFAERAREIAESYDVRAVFPVGAVVPLLDSYRFSDVVKAVLEAKSALPLCSPVHLFGAGHPMLFAIASALGCDLFDSAAYALYARDGRYMTVRGTEKLEEMNEFPCCCPVCSSYTPEELRKMDREDRDRLLAEHNLYVSFQEIRTVRQAIRNKTLFELVESRIRSHPYLLNAWRLLKEGKYQEMLELLDPNIKGRFFYTGVESLMRPAVRRHWERVLNVPPESNAVVATFSSGLPASLYLRPCFGVVPAQLLECYPPGHAEMPEDSAIDDEAVDLAIAAFVKYASTYKDVKFEVHLLEEELEVWGKMRDAVKREGLENVTFKVV